MSFPLADLLALTFRLQVSDDDSYVSDVSDSISVDTYSNEGGSERHNSGTCYSNKLWVHQKYGANGYFILSQKRRSVWLLRFFFNF